MLMRFMPERYVLQSFEALLKFVVTSTLDTFLKGSWMPSSIDQNSISQLLIALANTIFKEKGINEKPELHSQVLSACSPEKILIQIARTPTCLTFFTYIHRKIYTILRIQNTHFRMYIRKLVCVFLKTQFLFSNCW